MDISKLLNFATVFLFEYENGLTKKKQILIIGQTKGLLF
jgi:hypothetical protein